MNKRKKKSQYDYRKQYLSQFEGSYVYYIIDKRTQKIMYVGESANIVNRFDQHFNKPSDKTSQFNVWCKATGQNKANYQMLVLDLSDVEELDFDDRLLIEKVLQYYHLETIVNKKVPDGLTPYELERFEYITGLIDFDFRPYREVKVLKMNNKKALSTPIDKARN